MKPQKWFCLSGSVASAAAVFLFSNACMVSGILAQSTALTAVSSSQSGASSAPFLVAPSFSLAGAPTSVAMGDLNRDGKPDLITADPVSGNVTLFLGTGNGKFASGVEYATGSHPGAVAVADLNGDGQSEVIIGDETKGTVSVLSINGNGTLQLKQSLATGTAPAFLAAGDFNGDGKTDLAVVSRSGATLAILLNDGSGNLQKPALSTLRKTPAAVTVADFNNDGHADLALANADGTVSILLGTGTGTFRSLPDISVASGSLSSIVTGDFDHDGNVDLAVTQSAGKALSVLLGKGNGAFAAPVHYTVGNNPVSAVVADLDGDGFSDLVAINQGSNTYSVLGGNGDGTFRNSIDYVVGNGPVAAVAGNFDAEGHVDLAVVNPSSQTVSVPLGNGDGTFKAARSYFAGIGPRAVASADLNGDKLPDLVVTNYCGSDSTCSKSGSVAVFLANADGSYRLSNTYPLGVGPISVSLADVNGDKSPDIVALNRGDKTVSVLLSKGDGSFEQPFTLSVTDSPIAVAVGDFNQDGKMDLAVLGDCGAAKCSQPGSVEVLLGHGDGSFSASSSYAVGYSPTSLAAGDINEDKNLDIVVANRCGTDASCSSSGTATVLLGSASGKFIAGTDVAAGNSPSSIALGDLSGRGVQDLLVASSSDNIVSVMHGNGNGSFQAPTAYKVGNSPGSVVIADFNGDGKPDVAVANIQDSTVSVLFGKGDGSLNPSFALSVGTGPEALTAVAPTNSNRASLITANGNTGSATPGTDFTVLANAQPNVGSGLSTNALTSSSTNNTSSVNTSVTLTATLSSSSTVPTGNVTFESNGVSIPDCGNPVTLTAGVASCATKSLQGGSDSLTADYSGDSTFAGSISNTVAQTVNPLAATLALTSSAPTSSNVNESVTFTATVSAATVTPVAPSGTVSFTVNGKAITDCPAQTVNASGVATCTTKTLIAPSDAIVATYGSDVSFTVANPTSLTQTVNPLTATVALVSSAPTSSNVGDSVTFSATVSATTVTPVAPSGTVSFTVNGKAITDCPAQTVNASGVATCTTKTLVAPSDAIVATYGSDANFTVANPTSLTQNVTAVAATLALASSAPTSSNVNDSVTFTATVSSSVTGPAFSGKVSFTVNGSAILDCPPQTVNGSAKATCTTKALTATSDAIAATYSNDPSYTVANPASLTQNVNPLAATLALASSAPTSSNVDDSVTFTATVSASVVTPIAPAGSVSFTVNGKAISDCPAQTVNASGQATCTTKTLVATSDTIGATYGSDKNFTVATPASLTQSVKALTATLGLSAVPTSATVNQSVTFTAALSASALTPIVPAGTVTFTINGVSSSDCPAQKVNSSGAATCTTQSLVVPADVITATYTGDTNYSVTAPATFTETVTAAGAQTTLTSSNPTSSVNQTVTFSATVQPAGGGSSKTVPGGSVTFKQGTTTLCSAVTLTGNPATASCPFAFTSVIPSPGTTITATYSGDTNYTAGTPGTVTQIVQPSGTTIAVTSSPNPSTVNQSVSFLATLTAQNPGTAVPSSGTVVFLDTTLPATTLCSVSISTGGVVPACPFTFTSAGKHVVTATFTSTDPNFSSSSPASDTQTVNASAVSVSLSSNPTASTVNQSVTFSATVTASTSGAAIPQGSVAYTDASNTLCTVTLSGTGTVPTCAATLLTQGTHTIVATFTPSNNNFQTAASSVLNQSVSAGTTTVALVSSSNPSAVDQSVTFTATVAPSPAGTTNPTGKVTFGYTQNGSAVVLCSIAQAVRTVGSVTSAACSAPLTAAGTYTVTATYASGDANFTGSTSTPLSQTVNAAGTTVTVSTPIPSPSTVNQSVSFSAVVAPVSVTDTGLTLPTGSVTFSDSIAGVLCTSTLAADGTVPACKATLGAAGMHSISAAYSGDSNFSASTSANAFNLTVNKATTTIKIVSSSLTSVVTQAVTYTATVTPATAGTAPTGAITFSLTQGSTSYACAASATLPANGPSPYAESCTISFPATLSGNVTVSASYAGDSNFTGSTSSSITQTIQNFSSSVTPSLITLTQGSPTTANTNLTDPFNATAISLTSTALNGFSDPVAVIACTVEADSSGNAIPGLTCAPVASPTTATGVVVVTATSATPVGVYTIQLTVGDAKVSSLSHLVNVGVNVINLATQASTPIIGSTTATFNLSAPLPSGATLSYGDISIVNTDGTYTTIPITEVGIQISTITPVSGSSTSYSFTITAGTTATSQLTTPRTVLTAAAVGVPFLFVMSMLPGARKRRKIWLRYLGMVILAFAAMHSIGCSSGGFTRSSAKVGVVGSYVIQIQSTQNGTTTTVAVVPLLIEQ